MKRAYLKKDEGFTIVELLIVIVVIAILAAISIVAYNNVSKKANASAAQSDLSNFERKLMAYHAVQGTFPTSVADMADDGFAATDKMSWGDYSEGASTPRGKYKVLTDHFSTSNSGDTYNARIYYWDYTEGMWMVKSIYYYSVGGWSSSEPYHGNLRDPVTSSRGCAAQLLENCLIIPD